MKRQLVNYSIVSIILIFAMAGCAAMEKSTATNDEKMLTAAGFKMQLADTPGKIAHIQSMQQRKIITHVKKGSVYYAYADAEFCKCLYMGTEKNYQEYEKMSIQQNTAEMNQAAAMNWDAWGGLGGGWGW